MIRGNSWRLGGLSLFDLDSEFPSGILNLATATLLLIFPFQIATLLATNDGRPSGKHAEEGCRRPCAVLVRVADSLWTGARATGDHTNVDRSI